MPYNVYIQSKQATNDPTRKKEVLSMMHYSKAVALMTTDELFDLVAMWERACEEVLFHQRKAQALPNDVVHYSGFSFLKKEGHTMIDLKEMIDANELTYDDLFAFIKSFQGTVKRNLMKRATEDYQWMV